MLVFIVINEVLVSSQSVHYLLLDTIISLLILSKSWRGGGGWSIWGGPEISVMRLRFTRKLRTPQAISHTFIEECVWILVSLIPWPESRMTYYGSKHAATAYAF